MNADAMPFRPMFYRGPNYFGRSPCNKMCLSRVDMVATDPLIFTNLRVMFDCVLRNGILNKARLPTLSFIPTPMPPASPSPARTEKPINPFGNVRENCASKCIFLQQSNYGPPILSSLPCNAALRGRMLLETFVLLITFRENAVQTAE